MWACERFEWWKQVSPPPPAQKELGQVMEGRREGGSHRCWNTLGGAPWGMIWGMMREYIFETHLLHPELGGRLIDEKGVKTDVMCQNRARQSSLGVPSSATLLSGSETKPETRNVTPILVFLRKTRWKKGVLGNLTEKDKCGVWLWGETWTRASLSWSLQASSSPWKETLKRQQSLRSLKVALAWISAVAPTYSTGYILEMVTEIKMSYLQRHLDKVHAQRLAPALPTEIRTRTLQNTGGPSLYLWNYSKWQRNLMRKKIGMSFSQHNKTFYGTLVSGQTDNWKRPGRL